MERIKGRETAHSYRRWRPSAVLSLGLLGITLLAFSMLLRGDARGSSAGGRYRFGFGVAGGGIENYDVEQLRAGWYVDWGARMNPPRPAGLEHVQMVRLHQLTECWPERTRDRSACPYVQPYTYTLTSPTSLSAVASIAQTNPGSLWLIGNEMDRRDWTGGGQDETLPEVYAWAYHDLYHCIKEADPTAQVAIGGVVQPTPLRLEYLDKVLDEYQTRYGSMIPVDVWNIHNMIVREVAASWGADVPPGSTASQGRTYTIQQADSISIFEQQVLEFRQWMADKGERDKPLIISEYSVLYDESYGFDYERVTDYLYATFDYLTTATDASLGYPSDANRLVQRWAWYSLNDATFEGTVTHHHLFDPVTKEITQLGIDYGAYGSSCPTGSLAERSFNITVDLQRPNAEPPDASWAVPVHLSLHPPGVKETVCHEWDLTLDEFGSWSGQLEAYTGLYDVRLKNRHTLQNLRRDVDVSTSNDIHMGTLLEGDASDDNAIKGEDFSILRTTYFKQEGDADFDDRADFDEDGWVKGSDFSLLRTNYWQQGDQVVESVAGTAVAATADDGVIISILPSSSQVDLFEVFTVTLQVEAGQQPVDTVDAQVSFDPSLLQVHSITGATEPLNIELYSTYDNTEGKLTYSGGKLDGSAPTGTFTLCSVAIEARRATSGTPLAFTDSTGAYHQGTNVLQAGCDAMVSTRRRHIFLPLVLRR